MATLTARESEILTLSWECFETDSTVNYANLAVLAGLKNSASATTAYLSAKKKMQASGSSNLTAREREILALSWKCFNTPPQVDYAKLAEKAGLKNAASATTAFYNAKKKMLASADSASDEQKSATPAKKTKKTVSSARSKSTGAEEGDSIVEPGSVSPVKKRKRTSSVILDAVAGEGEGEEAEVAEAPKKKTKRAKGKKARSELGGNGDDDAAEVKGEPEGEALVEAALFETAQKFLKAEEEEG